MAKKKAVKKEPTHGGARKGAGRPEGSVVKEATKVMRIPLSKVDAVEKLIGK